MNPSIVEGVCLHVPRELATQFIKQPISCALTKHYLYLLTTFPSTVYIGVHGEQLYYATAKCTHMSNLTTLIGTGISFEEFEKFYGFNKSWNIMHLIEVKAYETPKTPEELGLPAVPITVAYIYKEANDAEHNT